MESHVMSSFVTSLSLSVMFSKFIYAVACIGTLFLFWWLNNIPLYHILFIYLFADRHLSCFHHLAIMNCAVINICVYSYWFLFVCVPLGLAYGRMNFSATDVSSEIIPRGSCGLWLSGSLQILGTIVKQEYLFLFFNSLTYVSFSCLPSCFL